MRLCIPVALVTAFAMWAPSAQATRVCPGDKAAFEKHLGEYASTRFLATLAKERSLTRTIEIEDQTKPEQPYVILVTSEELYTSRSWHEPDVVVTDCLDITGDTLRVEGRPQTYVRVTEDHVAYFNALLSGCFKDETGEAWCFKPNTIEIGKRRLEAQVLMDRAEMPDENLGVCLTAKRAFGFSGPLKTVAGSFPNYWSVVDEPPPIDWKRPWRTLTPLQKP